MITPLSTDDHALEQKEMTSWTYSLCVAFLAILLTLQFRSLYVFPMFDGARWWGDETGQILELRTELTDGVARIPYGLGSSVAITNGLVRGNSWMAAIVYGLPALVLREVANPVIIGRSITAILSIALLIVVFWLLRTLPVPLHASFLAITSLCSTRSWLFATHSARLDIAAALAILVAVHYLSSIKKETSEGRVLSQRWWYCLGVVTPLCATLSIHLLTLLGYLGIYAIFALGAHRDFRKLLAVLLGVVTTAGVLVGAYLLSGAPFSLYGPAIRSTQFESVVQGLPILRPFSRSVQVSNILERLTGLWSEAPFMLIVGIATLIGGIIVGKLSPYPIRTRFILQSAIIITISWLFFESPALYYYIHVLPLWAVSFGLVMTQAFSKKETPTGKPIVKAGIAIGIALLVCFGGWDADRASQTGARLTRNNSDAIEHALLHIDEKAHPVVLTQNPALAMLSHNRHIVLMSPLFLTFPVSDHSPTQVIAEQHVSYMMLYASSEEYNYSSEVIPLRRAADSIGTLVFSEAAPMLDVERNYFSDATSSNDTLLLYRMYGPR